MKAVALDVLIHPIEECELIVRLFAPSFKLGKLTEAEENNSDRYPNKRVPKDYKHKQENDKVKADTKKTERERERKRARVGRESGGGF
jgi:hypothetical protein